jgi:DNA primase
MQKLDVSRRAFLEELCQQYQAHAGEELLTYLNGRGLGTEVLERFRLGLVSDPPPEHLSYEGRMSIPIVKKCGVVSFKFRCIQDHKCGDMGHAKYLSGGPQYLYNVLALDEPSDTLEILEGEPDVWTLTSVFGLTCIGIPGVKVWGKHPEWRYLLRGHKRLRMWPDADRAGMELADELSRDLSGLEIVTLPSGLDVSETHMQYGPAHLAELAGL